MFLKRRYIFITILLIMRVVSLHASGFSVLSRADSDSTSNVGKNVFVKAVSSKKAVYAGEPFFVSYMLYSAIPIVNPETIIDVKFTNCFQQEVPFNRKLVSTKIIGGKEYTVITLQQYLVIAANTGTMPLPPVTIQLKVTSVDPKSFFNQEKEVLKNFTSLKSSIEVDKLPATADSNLFSGAVGKFKIKGYYKPFKKTDNLLTYYLTIDGYGNTKATELNVPSFPEGIESYNPTTSKKENVSEKGIESHFEYSYQVVANFKGKYSVPPVRFSYFDPDKKAYVIFEGEKYDWTVNTGPSPQAKTAPITNKPIDYFVKDKLNDKANQLYSYSPLFYGLFIAGFILLIYSYQVSFFNNIGRKIFETYINQKNKINALRNVDKLISVANQVEEDVFWKLLTAILFKYIKGEINTNGQKIPDLALNEEFLSNHLSENMYQNVAQFLRQVESMRFAAVSLADVNKLNCCRQLKSIVHTLHSNWHE